MMVRVAQALTRPNHFLNQSFSSLEMVQDKFRSNLPLVH